MIRRYMLDTNIVSYIIQGKSPALRAKLLNLAQDETACISAITEAELQYGIAKSPRAMVIGPAIEAFCARIQVLPWGREEAHAYGGLRAKQEAQGKPLGNLDLLIAAHAISAGAILVSYDKAFLQVSGLRATVDWATEF